MQVDEVLRMNDGSAKTSYGSNSTIQRFASLKGREILKESITKMCMSLLPDHLVMADLGCSNGPNTLLIIWEIINMVDVMSQDLNHPAPEFSVFLNDLPGNDFYSLIKLLPDFHRMIEEEKGADFGPCLISVTPKSFYGRLFPSNSVHIIHSCYSLHFLSKVPEGLVKDEGEALNKGNIYIAKTSPPKVWKAYYCQFKSDFTSFLRLRSQEMVPGGIMVLTFIGSKNSDDPDSVYEHMGITLNDMVTEGLIDKEKLDSFDLPFYSPTVKEVRELINEEGSFSLDKQQTFGLAWDTGCAEENLSARARYVADTMRAVAEPMLASHFGKKPMDGFFSRFRAMAMRLMASRQMEYFTVVLAMTRKTSQL